MTKEQIEKIRDARFVKGYLISQLIDTFGSQAVYEAFDITPPYDIRKIIEKKRRDLPELNDA